MHSIARVSNVRSTDREGVILQTVLYVLCALLWIAALACLFLIGNTAQTELIGCLLGLSGMVAFTGGAIVGSVDGLTDQLKQRSQQ